MNCACILVRTVFVFLFTICPATAAPFKHEPAGKLALGSGQGATEAVNYAPGMRFPLEAGPSYANSQVWGVGGARGKPGQQCNVANYSYPWRDNYCETRTWPVSLCPAGTGHQGQDIRPATCAKGMHWAVAAVDGTVTNVGNYSVYVLSTDGRTRFDYLHMSNVAVRVGAKVARGARLGTVSNVFNGAPTTIHLHFNIRRNLPGLGWTFVPPYTALTDAYLRLLNGSP